MNELKRLELRGNKIEKIEGLNFSNKIHTLTLSSNLIKSIKNEDLPKNDYLEELGLFGNFIGDNENEKINEEIFNEVCMFLSEKFHKLKSLYIGGNYIFKIKEFNLKIKNKIKTLEFIDGHNI
jgi:Leucine-rich repeat (LRR) protein